MRIKYFFYQLLGVPRFDFHVIGTPKEEEYLFSVWGENNKNKLESYYKGLVVDHIFHHLEIFHKNKMITNFCYISPIRNGLKYLKVVEN